MKIHHTFCAFRLGDNMAHLQLLRKLAQAHPDHKFIHACRLDYCAQRLQLGEMIADLPNIRLHELGEEPNGSINAWKGVRGLWYGHALKNDYIAFYLEFYGLLCAQMGLPCPILNAEDILFDYPAIRRDVDDVEWDMLLVNSAPMSGQFQGFREREFEQLAQDLAMRKLRVVTTSPVGAIPCTQHAKLSVTGIGNVSLRCSYVVMVSTGPSWATFNVWNRETVKARVIFLDSERIGLSPHTIHVSSMEAARGALKGLGLL
jgi:hypothetical protein